MSKISDYGFPQPWYITVLIILNITIHLSNTFYKLITSCQSYSKLEWWSLVLGVALEDRILSTFASYDTLIMSQLEDRIHSSFYIYGSSIMSKLEDRIFPRKTVHFSERAVYIL